MNMIESRRLHERCERLLELPPLIDGVGKRRVALRAEKRALERKLKAREATIRKECLELSIYKECANADERSAVFEDAKFSDPNWEHMAERLEQLSLAIDKAQQEESVLDHERKALKAVLEREYAQIIAEHMDDRTLVNAVARGQGVRA